MEPSIAVLLPCRNEAAAIGAVVRGFRAALPGAAVYVYDNASTDDTARIAREAGAVVRAEAQPGKGNVVRRMFADVDAFLRGNGFQYHTFAGMSGRAFKPLKKMAVAMNVIPESKRARLFLKRVVFGSLQTMPHDISKLPAPIVKPQPLPMDRPNSVYQVVLCAGRRS
jgi:glycosyltransferase involved in cell wall biosynthesis